jgi:two-component system nitrogen regulation sensor histidine kinase NtrY
MRRRTRTEKLLFIGIPILIGLLALIYYIIQKSDQWNPRYFIKAPYVLFFLSITLIVLILGVLFILLRNFIKLIVERRRGILGSKFRTKLVFIFLIPLLVPSIALFYAAMTIIQKSVENLLTPPVNEITQYSKEIVDYFNETAEKQCAAFARQISEKVTSGKYLDMDREGMMGPLLEKMRAEYHLDMISVHLMGEGKILQTHSPSSEQDGMNLRRLQDFPEDFLRSVYDGETVGSIDVLPKGYIVRSAVPILSSYNRRDVVGVLIGGMFIPEHLARKVISIDESRKDYLQTKVQKGEIKRIYIYLIAFIALLILFSATWVGMYLTNQITVPVQKLAEGTKELSAGNLDFEVEVNAGDELGMLVDSFNRMTQELKENKRILEERRKYIETLLDNVTTGVISLDRQGRISAINREAIQTLNRDKSKSFIGVPYDNLLEGKDLTVMREFIAKHLEQEELEISREFPLNLRGRPLHLASHFNALKDAMGKHIGMLIVIDDLTQLIRAQKMEAWREVARRIAHEIKNPLTPVQLSAQRILKKSSEESQDLRSVVKEGATTIINEVNTLKIMVDEFSKFSRMPVIRLEPSDPHEVIEAAIQLYEGIQTGIDFLRDFDSQKVTVLIDYDQIKRVVINLIDNSIAVMDGKGYIKIVTRMISGNKIFRMEFSDNGPGISAENKKRLFIPYFSTKKKGTGLGLAIVQSIISDHNGVITVEDNEPKGTKFIIKLPA